MRKLIFITLVILLFVQANVYGEVNPFLGIRNNIFEESNKIKALLGKTKDPVLIGSMFDTCVIAITQLDAYFSMVGIFNNIPKEEIRQESVDYLLKWLSQIKAGIDLNIRTLDTATKMDDARTKLYKDRLKELFMDLSGEISKELVRISALKNSAKK